MQRLHEQQLTEVQLKASAAISDVRKKSAVTASQLKQKDELIGGYQEMAMEVSEEFSSLSKTYRKTASTMKDLETTATKRLLKTKDASRTISELREQLDDTQEELCIQLDEAFEEIRSSTQELERKTEEAEEWEVLAHLAGRDIDDLAYHKVEKHGKPKSWSPIVTQLVVEMLANGTPPSAVSANILSVCKLLFPGAPIVRELPSIRFVRSCRTVLLHLAKTLAAYEIACTDVYEQLFTDGTTRRQTEFQNVVIGILRG